MTLMSFFVVLLTSAPLQAGDYVDDINQSATKRNVGQRVIYEMNVGAFTSAGTFSAAADKLDDLKTLGVDIVWLMPIYPRGGGINSPYAAKNFQQVNPSYGTIADLRELVNRAHELQMEVWLDWVPNHTATDADWVTSHPEYYKKSGGQMIHPNGYGDVWQLDYSNADLVNAMNDCLKFWIDEADIDGYRCDYISSPQIPTSYWQTTIPLIKSYRSDKEISFLGEADIANDATRLKTVGFDYDYAWQYQTSLLNFGPAGVYASSLKANANKLIDTQKGISFGRMLYLTNHDQNWNEAKQTLVQKYGDNRYPLTVLAHTVWGMPLIYNGQEVGGNQALNYFTDTKISWNSPDHKMQNTLRTLCALKHDVEAFRDGNTTESHHTTTWLDCNSNNVLAYVCRYGDSEALVVLNFSTSAVSTTITGLTAGEYGLWLNSETIGQGVSRQQVQLSAAQYLTLEAKGYRVYVKGTFSEEEPPAPEVYTPVLDSVDEVSIFFETPNADTYSVWAWGDLGGGEAYCSNASWPGDVMTLMGQNAAGRSIYRCVFTKVSQAPQYLIISKNNGNTKIYDGVAFVNHGYYVEGKTEPTQIITETAGIDDVKADRPADGIIYTLSGRQVASDKPLTRGFYIKDGRKFMVR